MVIRVLYLAILMRNFFPMSSTPRMTENIKIYFILYVTESLHSLCLADAFRFSLTLESYKVCLDYSSTV